MANRRMFSLRVVNSARFLKMPHESQALYFHLGLHADDDGVVEAYSIMRQVGTNEDNLKVLVGKGFVKILNEDLVSYIVDWREHNRIRADRKIDSIYKNLLLKVIGEDELLEPKPRADTRKPTGRHLDAKWTAQDRLGKVSIVKDKEEKKPLFKKPKIEEIQKYCEERKNNVDVTTFFDFYESKGWMIGKNKMKDWRAAVRTWETRDRGKDSIPVYNKIKDGEY